MTAASLDLVRDGTIAILTLNRPEQRNALNTELRDAITRTLAELEADDGVSVVVVTGAGRAFCAGFDLKEFAESSMQEVLGSDSAQRYHERLRVFGKPLIAAVNGPALAGGFDLAMLCDMRIASEAATFGHPEVKFGSGVMFAPLADVVGVGIASDLAFTGRTIGASEALRLGVVSRITDPKVLLSEAVGVASEIAQAPLQALTRTKRSLVQRRR